MTKPNDTQANFNEGDMNTNASDPLFKANIRKNALFNRTVVSRRMRNMTIREDDFKADFDEVLSNKKPSNSALNVMTGENSVNLINESYVAGKDKVTDIPNSSLIIKTEITDNDSKNTNMESIEFSGKDINLQEKVNTQHCVSKHNIKETGDHEIVIENKITNATINHDNPEPETIQSNSRNISYIEVLDRDLLKKRITKNILENLENKDFSIILITGSFTIEPLISNKPEDDDTLHVKVNKFNILYPKDIKSEKNMQIKEDGFGNLYLNGKFCLVVKQGDTKIKNIEFQNSSLTKTHENIYFKTYTKAFLMSLGQDRNQNTKLKENGTNSELSSCRLNYHVFLKGICKDHLKEEVCVKNLSKIVVELAKQDEEKNKNLFGFLNNIVKNASSKSIDSFEWKTRKAKNDDVNRSNSGNKEIDGCIGEKGIISNKSVVSNNVKVDGHIRDNEENLNKSIVSNNIKVDSSNRDNEKNTNRLVVSNNTKGDGHIGEKGEKLNGLVVSNNVIIDSHIREKEVPSSQSITSNNVIIDSHIREKVANLNRSVVYNNVIIDGHIREKEVTSSQSITSNKSIVGDCVEKKEEYSSMSNKIKNSGKDIDQRKIGDISFRKNSNDNIYDKSKKMVHDENKRAEQKNFYTLDTNLKDLEGRDKNYVDKKISYDLEIKLKDLDEMEDVTIKTIKEDFIASKKDCDSKINTCENLKKMNYINQNIIKRIKNNEDACLVNSYTENVNEEKQVLSVNTSESKDSLELSTNYGPESPEKEIQNIMLDKNLEMTVINPFEKYEKDFYSQENRTTNANKKRFVIFDDEIHQQNNIKNGPRDDVFYFSLKEDQKKELSIFCTKELKKKDGSNIFTRCWRKIKKWAKKENDDEYYKIKNINDTLYKIGTKLKRSGKDMLLTFRMNGQPGFFNEIPIKMHATNDFDFSEIESKNLSMIFKGYLNNVLGGVFPNAVLKTMIRAGDSKELKKDEELSNIIKLCLPFCMPENEKYLLMYILSIWLEMIESNKPVEIDVKGCIVVFAPSIINDSYVSKLEDIVNIVNVLVDCYKEHNHLFIDRKLFDRFRKEYLERKNK